MQAADGRNDLRAGWKRMQCIRTDTLKAADSLKKQAQLTPYAPLLRPSFALFTSGWQPGICTPRCRAKEPKASASAMGKFTRLSPLSTIFLQADSTVRHGHVLSLYVSAIKLDRARSFARLHRELLHLQQDSLKDKRANSVMRRGKRPALPAVIQAVARYKAHSDWRIQGSTDTSFVYD